MAKTNKAEVKKISERNQKKFMTFADLKGEINHYGFSYSFKDFAIKLALVMALILGAGVYYQSNGVVIALLILLTAFALPKIIVSQYSYIYERKRFDDVIMYCEQMIYSFKKMPKIQTALEDTRTLLNGRIAELVDEAIEYINKGISQGDIYEEAFAIIEKEYYCDKIVSLHKFLMKIERKGGHYDNSINVLLNDIQDWNSRTYVYQKEKKSTKGKLVICIVLSLVISGATLFMLPKGVHISGSLAYQITTGIFLSLLITLYTVIQTKLSGSWLGESEIKTYESTIERWFYLAYEYNEKVATKKRLPILIVCAFAGAYIGYMNYVGARDMIKFIIAGCIVLMGFLLYNDAKKKKKMAKKKISNEIEKEFPNWLRDMSVNLQAETVQVAIINSIPNAAYVLRPFLKQLVEDFEKDPTGIGPYLNFISEYDLPEIKSTLKMFYALNNNGRDEAEEQINVLLKRNQALLDKSEKIRHEDTLAGMGFICMLPMFASVIKLCVDMMLMLSAFMSQMNNPTIGV